MNYKDSGVDIEAGRDFVEKIKKKVSSIGGFNGMIKVPSRYKNPVLVSGTDGVGTKLNIAKIFDDYSTIGIDLVAMCVNDVICCGAKPLYFLDYISTEELNDRLDFIVEGILKGCDLAGCELVGGETAELPGMYENDKFDLAGFALGVVKKDLSKSIIKGGEYLIGIPSSGPHSNGFSLLRNLLPIDKIPLTPTRIYTKEIIDNIYNIKACAHITGGGIHGNITRILQGHQYTLDLPKKDDWWSMLFSLCKIDEYQFENIFNCGWGMICIADNELPINNSKIIGTVL